MGVGSWIKSKYGKAKSFVQSIGPRIQGNNYGSGTNIGGTTYYATGPTRTTTGSSGSSSGGGSSGGGGSSSGGGGGRSGGGGSSSISAGSSGGSLGGGQSDVDYNYPGGDPIDQRPTQSTIASQISSNKPTEEFGVPLVTTSEYKRFEGTRQGGTMLEISSPEQAERLRQVTPTSGIGIQTSPSTFISRMFGPTQDQFEFTRSNIIAAQTSAERLGLLETEFRSAPESFIGKEGVVVEEKEQGREITLTPEFIEGELNLSDIRSQSILQARKEFQELPGGRINLPFGIGGGFYTGEKGRGIVGSKLTGIAQTGIGIAEFYPSVLASGFSGTFEEGDIDRGFIGWKQVELGGEFSDIKYQPTSPTIRIGVGGFFESFRSPQFKARTASTAIILSVGGASLLSGAGASGGTFGEKVISTAGQFSLIRPVPGIYTIPTTETTPSRFISVVKETGGIQTREIIGYGKGFMYSSTQSTKLLGGKVSFGSTETTLVKDAISISSAGKISSGIQITGSQGFIFSPSITGDVVLRTGGEKSVLEGVKGGTSQTFTQTKYSVYLEGKVPGEMTGFLNLYSPGKTFKVFRGAGTAEDLGKGITAVDFGKRTSLYTTESFEGGWIRQPTGNIRLDVSASGYEIKIYDVFGTGVKILSPASITKTPLSQTFGQVSGQASFTKLFPSQELQLGSIQSTLGSQQSITQQSTSQVLGLTLTQRKGFTQRTALQELTTIIPSTSQAEIERTKTLFSGRTSSKTITIPRQQERVLSAVIPKQASMLRQIRTGRSLFMGSGTGIGGGFGTGMRGFILPPGFFLGPGLRTRPSLRGGIFGSFKKSYTPSLTARTFRLYGKVSKQALTGQVSPFERRYLLSTKKRRKVLGI